MKLFLIKVLFFLLFFYGSSYASNFNAEYKVSVTGIKIGYFSWSLSVNNNNYQTEITLKNSGFFSPLYEFKGNYLANGVIEEKVFKTKRYKQLWKTKEKTKIVNMSFDDYLTELKQEPVEKEIARINLDGLYLYSDPLTSFLNILNGSEESKTVDGRRIYTLKKNNTDLTKKIILEIIDYKNIWADHKRNDLKKIEFLIEDEFLPHKIYVYFKKRVFKLEKI